MRSRDSCGVAASNIIPRLGVDEIEMLVIMCIGNSESKMLSIPKLFLGLALGLLTQQVAQSQGAIIYLSNLSGPPVANISNARSGFITGNNPSGYVLNAVQ